MPPDNMASALASSMFAPWLMFMCIMPLVLAALVVRIIAAMAVATGHNFRYPLIARGVNAFLKEPPSVLPARLPESSNSTNRALR